MTHITQESQPLRARLVDAAFGCAAVLCGCCFLFAAWQSLWDTCWLTPEEQTGFFRTGLAWQICLVALCAAALWGLTRLIHRLRWQRFVLPCTLAFTLVCGAVWIWSANAAQAGEPALCNNIAVGALQGDWYTFRPGGYMTIFPFQAGFIAYLEGIYALFGAGNTAAVSAISLCFVLLGHAALYCFAQRISPFPQAKTLTALLCAATWPWALYTTFNYGNFVSLTLWLWAGLALLRFLDALKTQRRRAAWGFLAAAIALMAAAMLLKSTALIPLVAFCIVLALCAVRQRDWRPLLALVLLCALTFLPSQLAQRWYEVRSGQTLGGGTPKLVWISMGLEEGPLAMGWFNGKTYTALPDAQMDADACTAQQKSDIAARLAAFRADPAYARSFFLQKHNSQWLDPTFGAIHATSLSRYLRDSRWPALTSYVYSRTRDSLPIRVTDALQTLVYAAAALGLCAAAWQRAAAWRSRPRFGPGADAALLAITALGGYLYLLLSEGKSQYALSYYILLLPYAAHGLCVAWHCATRAALRLARCGKHF